MACGGDEAAKATAGPTCEAPSIRDDFEPIDVSATAIHIEVDGSLQLGLVEQDVRTYLGTLWGVKELATRQDAPAFDQPYTLWISSSPEAVALVGGEVNDGYAIRRVQHADSTVVVVYAPDASNLAHGAYALLEELGVRFFHPKQELVPRLGGAYLPRQLDVRRAPAFAVRGVQLHLLHPLEYFEPFNAPGDENLQDAKRFIDWLVKTGQNHVQWSILDTVEFASWKPHAAQIIDYAHQRGVTVGAVVDVWGGASLQNAYDLITAQDGWQAELEAQLDRLMELPWDVVEAGLGEFLAVDSHEVLTWLDHMTAYAAAHYPHTRMSITNHVGNSPDLWIDWEGETVYYYHLPGFADERLTNTVHTVFFFDLYRDWGGYGHPDFHFHRAFLFEQLAKRKMRYMPESAYWCTADIDVPIFLPEYIHARWTDIHSLDRDTRELGLPPLEGHVMFTSGHEWGYWMTDYLAAKMMWNPGEQLDPFLRDVTRSYGSCAPAVGDAFVAFTHLQSELLFDRRLVPYLSGEDLHDDLGYLLEITTHPPRVPYHEVLAMGSEERDAFEREVIDGLSEFAANTKPLESAVADVCKRTDDTLRPWCLELRDGMRITRLRAEHAKALYQAVIASARKSGAPDAPLANARKIRASAAEVIAAREKYYRFDLERLTSTGKNPTRYPFGYLKQAHTMCLWERQELQASKTIASGVAPSFTTLPSCQD